jgi:hypothetical protein
MTTGGRFRVAAGRLAEIYPNEDIILTEIGDGTRIVQTFEEMTAVSNKKKKRNIRL